MKDSLIVMLYVDGKIILRHHKSMHHTGYHYVEAFTGNGWTRWLDTGFFTSEKATEKAIDRIVAQDSRFINFKSIPEINN